MQTTIMPVYILRARTVLYVLCVFVHACWCLCIHETEKQKGKERADQHL